MPGEQQCSLFCCLHFHQTILLISLLQYCFRGIKDLIWYTLSNCWCYRFSLSLTHTCTRARVRMHAHTHTSDTTAPFLCWCVHMWCMHTLLSNVMLSAVFVWPAVTYLCFCCCCFTFIFYCPDWMFSCVWVVVAETCSTYWLCNHDEV